MARPEIIQQLAGILSRLVLPHPVRVGIDGVDGSGKTTLADELALALRTLGRDVLRVSLDDFHRPKADRHRQERYSPRGYYEDAFNYPVIISDVLTPLGPGGNRLYRRSSFDLHSDTPLVGAFQEAPTQSILLFDGVFLQKTELAGYWDFRTFVDCRFDKVLERVLKRDLALFGSKEEARKLYLERFIPAQRLYLDQVRPLESADVVFENDDFENPRLKVKNAL